MKALANIFSLGGILIGFVAGLSLIYAEYFIPANIILLEPTGPNSLSAAVETISPITALIRRIAFFLGLLSIASVLASYFRKEKLLYSLVALGFGLSPLFALSLGAAITTIVLIVLFGLLGTTYILERIRESQPPKQK